MINLLVLYYFIVRPRISSRNIVLLITWRQSWGVDNSISYESMSLQSHTFSMVVKFMNSAFSMSVAYGLNICWVHLQLYGFNFAELLVLQCVGSWICSFIVSSCFSIIYCVWSEYVTSVTLYCLYWGQLPCTGIYFVISHQWDKIVYRLY